LYPGTTVASPTGPFLNSASALPAPTGPAGSLFWVPSTIGGSVAPTINEVWYQTYIDQPLIGLGATNLFELNEASGSTAADSVGSATGTWSGSFSRVTALTQDQTNAVQLSTNGSLSTTVSGPSSTSNNFSYAILFQTGSTVTTTCHLANNNCTIASNATGVNYNTGTSILVASNQELEVALGGASGGFFCPGSTISNSTLYLAVVTYSNATNTTTCYLNGTNQGSQTGHAYTAGGDWYLGYNPNIGANNLSFPGIIQSFAFFDNQTLTAQQASALWAGVQGYAQLSTVSNFSATAPLVVTQSSTSVNYSCPTCGTGNVYTASGSAVASTYHTVQDSTTCTLSSGACTAIVTFSGAAVFSSTMSYTCFADINGTGAIGSPLTYITATNSSASQENFNVYNGAASGTAQLAFFCAGT
jgi:hypothetical protein